MPERILLADDDAELSELLGEYLTGEGFEVVHAADGEAALERLRSPGIDAVVLDIMMPRLNGIEVLKRLRRESTLPVLMLTARGEDLDRIIGLELGADDYLPKPCNPRELVARLRAVLRRTGAAGAPGVVTVGDLELHAASRHLYREGEPIELTSTEFSLAQVLLQRAGTVVQKRDLYLAALGREPVRFDRSVDMHLSNLRRKLGEAPGGGVRIETVRGIGYLYVVPESPD
ncbi:MAG: response regulator transcription factor [Pseudomonadota bacterium]